jgi:hypothetical protein
MGREMRVRSRVGGTLSAGLALVVVQAVGLSQAHSTHRGMPRGVGTQELPSVAAIAITPRMGSRAQTATLACHSTNVTMSDLNGLRDAWRHSRGLPSRLRLVTKGRGPGAPRGGYCGKTKWALANFGASPGQHLSEQDQIRLQDGPDVFRRRSGDRWRDISDTGGSIPCGGSAGLPRELVRVWRLRCS